MSEARWLSEPARAGVFHLTRDAREFADAAAAAGIAAYRIDIGHAHDAEDFLRRASQAMNFPGRFGASREAFAEGLKDLSWTGASGWVVILEKSKHFCAGHAREFKEAMDLMDRTAEHWRSQGKPFWTLIGGPDGWKSGWPDMPDA